MKNKSYSDPSYCKLKSTIIFITIGIATFDSYRTQKDFAHHILELITHIQSVSYPYVPYSLVNPVHTVCNSSLSTLSLSFHYSYGT